MSALSLLRDWRRQVQEELLPGLHGHQSKALADLSFAMTIADHCWGFIQTRARSRFVAKAPTLAWRCAMPTAVYC